VPTLINIHISNTFLPPRFVLHILHSVPIYYKSTTTENMVDATPLLQADHLNHSDHVQKKTSTTSQYNPEDGTKLLILAIFGFINLGSALQWYAKSSFEGGSGLDEALAISQKCSLVALGEL
jgi:hypothetical protein